MTDEIKIVVRIPKTVHTHAKTLAATTFTSLNTIFLQSVEEKWQRYCQEINKSLPIETQPALDE